MTAYVLVVSLIRLRVGLMCVASLNIVPEPGMITDDAELYLLLICVSVKYLPAFLLT